MELTPPADGITMSIWFGDFLTILREETFRALLERIQDFDEKVDGLDRKLVTVAKEESETARLITPSPKRPSALAMPTGANAPAFGEHYTSDLTVVRTR